jgi:hypothetical protein
VRPLSKNGEAMLVCSRSKQQQTNKTNRTDQEYIKKSSQSHFTFAIGHMRWPSWQSQLKKKKT